ncbi:Fe-S cluster assembly protein SufD [Pelagibacterium montanilacus]|uniref:Fe-S cluster assembly protein SufD n=1 Tax=Pelagibacterium montanilacus TaxID=2185280 RepID=UPI0013DFCA85|nr:Fe-S cluster assembly protein SufD [Pelagibacterium montanilacus]
MNDQTPIRLSGAEETLLAQLESVGAHEAAGVLRASGLPTRRVEAYHYTDLRMLLSDVPPLAGPAPASGAPEFDIPGAYRIVVANGEIQNAGTAPAGVAVSTRKGSPLDDRDDVLVRLNTALVGTALDLELTGSVDAVIHIDRRLEGDAAHGASAARISVAPGATATILETISGSEAAHMSNGGTTVTLGEGAKVTHIVVDRLPESATQFGTVDYRLEADSRLVSLVINAGAALARTQVFAEFAGERSHSDFFGLNLVDTDEHRDITLDIRHAVPNTTSTELYKQIARGRGKGVFQGKITVVKDAQKTDAQMMTQGLMLSEEAEILAKPELVIYADDVVCAHGATCGDLDDTSLFYLMSRGIPRAEAETMLIRSFLAELVDGIEAEYVAEALTGLIDSWLAKVPK